MHSLLLVIMMGISLCDGHLVLQNNDLSSLDSLIRELGSRILLKEFGSYKCVVVLSDVPEGLSYLNPWFPTTVRISLAIGYDLVERLLVSALDADCQGLLLRCRDAAAGVDAFLKASKLVTRRVNRRLLVLPAAQSPGINISSIFALRNIDLVPDIVVARLADNNSFDLVTLSLTGEESWRDELVVAQWCQGRGLNPPSADLYPDRLASLGGRRLVTATLDYPPYVILNSAENVFDGLETRIMSEFIKKMNATWIVVEDTTDMWGTVWLNGSGNGMLGAAATDEVDVAFAALCRWYPDYLFLDYSRPYLRSGVVCLAPRPLLLPGWQVPLLPFSPAMWTAVGFSVVFATSALYAVKKLTDWFLECRTATAFNNAATNHLIRTALLPMLRTSTFSSDGSPTGGRYRTVEDCFFRSVGLLVLQTPDVERLPRRVVGPTRHVLSWLLITYLLVTSSYGGGLSSVLTIPRYEPPIDSVADLHDSGLEWAQTDIAYINSLRGLTDKVYLDLIERYRVLTPDILRSRITTRDVAIAVERLPGGFFTIGDYIDEEAVSKWLRPMREDIYWANILLVVRKGWPHLEQLNDIIDRLFETGIIRAWEGQVARKWLAPRVQLAAQVGIRSYAQAPDGPITLRLTHVQGEFALLIIGLCMSLLIFLLEIVIFWKTNSSTRLEFSSTIKVTLERHHL